MMMKKLTKIRLINWHYFTNETISVNGSFLITGENTSGKSTVLDAIQLVLTTNTRKFNTAANEKSKRNLKGYVRCKTGNEDNAYLRAGSVITYVALEFYEEKRGNYFTIGVKIDSPDEEGKLSVKWFVEECQMDKLTFLKDGRPSMTDEFRRDNRKIQLITQVSEAKARFGRRLGNLDDRYFDMIPKSLAFKPMDKVKDFINKFILSEKKIEVSSLRKNINLLKEFEELMQITKDKIDKLEEIIEKYDDVEVIDREIQVNDVLIRKAEVEEIKVNISKLVKDINLYGRELKDKQQQEKTAEDNYNSENERLTGLKIASADNEITKLISDTENEIKHLELKLNYIDEKFTKLETMVNKLINTLKVLSKYDEVIVQKEQVLGLINPKFDGSEKSELAYDIRKVLEEKGKQYNRNLFGVSNELKDVRDKKIKTEAEIRNLKNKKLIYPPNTNKLKEAIEREFINQGIDSSVRIFSDLLEITDEKWQNAIEGYLSSQRFYIIIDPQYYSIALQVYHKIKKEVHSVGLVNTGKLKLDNKTDKESLGYVITSDNRYAKAYANYLLNRVIRCEKLGELKEHKIAITADCMLYQNYAVRKIDEKVYRTPFIGAHAYKIQLDNKEKELEELKAKEISLKAKEIKYHEIVEALDACNMEVIEENITIPEKKKDLEIMIGEKNQQLKKAKDNPNYIEIQLEIQECQENVGKYSSYHKGLIREVERIKNEISNKEIQCEKQGNLLKEKEYYFDQLSQNDTGIVTDGIIKFEEQIKTKSAAIIVANFSPRRKGLENKKDEYSKALIILQSNFCSKYDCDLGNGVDSITNYNDEHHKLVASEIVKYEDQLNKAKGDCELEFKESFLARLKENIDSAKLEFKQLNKALKGIYYGEDSYRFEITHNKKKESIYRMIMSDQNTGGFTLFSDQFEKEYHEEMNDLFDKLTAYDDQGDKVIDEYTDYRGYLDYDIIVEKKDGTSQRFSVIYGEKSGGETQTPYYVSIAASFVQLYKLGDTIRIIMLDEAFDKMDDNRIASMMAFFSSQNFQIILATPPAKMEVIGEKVDTILMAMREGSQSIIEVYDL